MNDEPATALDRRLAALRQHLADGQPADLVPGVLRRVRTGSRRRSPGLAVAAGISVAVLLLLFRSQGPDRSARPSAPLLEAEVFRAAMARTRFAVRVGEIRRLTMATGAPTAPDVREACLIAMSHAARELE